jgi:hypothetical protein
VCVPLDKLFEVHVLHLVVQQLPLVGAQWDVPLLPPLMHNLRYHVLALDQLPPVGVPPPQSLPVEPLYPLDHRLVLSVDL